MSLYRQTRTGGRGRWLVPVLAAAVALVAGLMIGRATVSEPSFDERVADVRESVEPVIAGMELARTHYAKDHGAGRAQAERARAAFGRIDDDLAALDPGQVRRARAALDDAVSAAERDGSPAEVAEAARAAEAQLRPLAGR